MSFISFQINALLRTAGVFNLDLSRVLDGTMVVLVVAVVVVLVDCVRVVGVTVIVVSDGTAGVVGTVGVTIVSRVGVARTFFGLALISGPGFTVGGFGGRGGTIGRRLAIADLHPAAGFSAFC